MLVNVPAASENEGGICSSVCPLGRFQVGFILTDARSLHDGRRSRIQSDSHFQECVCILAARVGRPYVGFYDSAVRGAKACMTTITERLSHRTKVINAQLRLRMESTAPNAVEMLRIDSSTACQRTSAKYIHVPVWPQNVAFQEIASI